MSDLTGQILANRYRVDSFIGRGGMAEVYKVWDSERATYLALKLLREDLAHDVVFLRRFQREAKNLAKLQHPNIVRFYGIEQDDLFTFILMDFIEGTSLRTAIFKHRGEGMLVPEVISIMRGVCSALHFAHRNGIVHCDMKPGNILIDERGRPMVTDLGIARMSDASTATMVGVGTPAYMAPEQIRSQDPTPQSDIYALGIVLYEMLTGGERPFTGESARTTGSTGEKVRWEQLHLPPPSPRKWNSRISPKIESIVLRCLAKEPGDRFVTTLELLNALLAASGEAVEESPITQPQVEIPQKEPPAVSSSQSISAEQPTAPKRITKWMPWAAGLVIMILISIIITQAVRSPGRVVVEAPTAIPTQMENTLPGETPTIEAPTETSIRLTPTPALLPITQGKLLAVGSTQISPIDSMVMVFIPPGEFAMGNKGGISNQIFDEFPRHKIYLDSFWMDQSEVTNAMFAVFLNDKGNQVEGGSTWFNAKDDDYLIFQPDGNWVPMNSYEDYPVYEVTWFGAISYCEWAGRRLPTEAEWEKAAKGGLVGEIYPWGNRNPVCRFTAISGAQFEDCDGGVVQVMSFKPNEFGLFDMSGNVAEWVSDWYTVDYYENSDDINPKGPSTGNQKGIRGGSWRDSFYDIRSSSRMKFYPHLSSSTIGFRCAMDIIH